MTVDGDERWRRSAGGEGIGVTVADGTAYVLAGDTIQAIDAVSGEQAWSHSIPDDIRSEGLVRGITVVDTDSATYPVYHTDAYVVGLGNSGTQQWQVRPAGPGFDDIAFRYANNSLVTQGRYVYFLGDDGAHGVVDASAGEIVWQRVDDYADRNDKRGGAATFGDSVVNSGKDATVLSIPGGRAQWNTGISTYDGLTGTENALYVSGNAGGTATVRSFSEGGGINWTLEFGEYRGYDSLTNDEYEFYNVPPAVTDGSILIPATSPSGERSLRCYRLPESEWLAPPQTESESGSTAVTTTADAGSDDADQAGRTRTEPATSTEPTAPTRDRADESGRGFFTNGADRPLTSLTGTNLTLFSTVVTVLGILLTLVDLVRGGDE